MISSPSSSARLHSLILAVMLLASSLAAQQQTAPLSLDNLPTETLHMNVNRMQFPTMLIDEQEHFIPDVPLNDFNITFDAGATFRPSGMHIEQDDPLAIAVLLDLSGGEKEILESLPDSLSSFAAESLHPQDRLFFYALDCSLIGFTSPVAPDPAAVRSATNSIMQAPVHGNSGKPSCARSLRLWDAIARISQGFHDNPARQVLLVVSRGVNHGKDSNFHQVAEAANFNSVAVFGIRDIAEYYKDHSIEAPDDLHSIAYSPMFTLDREDPMLELCVRSGGFVLNMRSSGVRRRLRSLITLLRSRYVLEFARPDKNFAGWHAMKITAAGVPYALPTGDSAPIAAATTSPNTLPANPSPVVIGDRHVLQPKSP